MPWDDTWGTAAAIGIAGLLAATAFEQGHHWYKTGLCISLGNIAISLFALFGDGGELIGGWFAIPFFAVISITSYCAVLGLFVTFRRQKAVKCFRCQYVSWPSETDEEYTPFNELEWQQFRNLNGDALRNRKNST
jgi:hypothetical protein